MNQKPVEEWTFEELGEFVVGDLFNALIEGGTKKMKSRFFTTFTVISKWVKANQS